MIFLDSTACPIKNHLKNIWNGKISINNTKSTIFIYFFTGLPLYDRANVVC